MTDADVDPLTMALKGYLELQALVEDVIEIFRVYLCPQQGVTVHWGENEPRYKQQDERPTSRRQWLQVGEVLLRKRLRSFCGGRLNY